MTEPAWQWFLHMCVTPVLLTKFKSGLQSLRDTKDAISWVETVTTAVVDDISGITFCTLMPRAWTDPATSHITSCQWQCSNYDTIFTQWKPSVLQQRMT